MSYDMGKVEQFSEKGFRYTCTNVHYFANAVSLDKRTPAHTPNANSTRIDSQAPRVMDVVHSYRRH